MYLEYIPVASFSWRLAKNPIAVSIDENGNVISYTITALLK
jgi:hypothetical protein